MIRNLSLQYFKCFVDLTLPLSPLTLLSGTNASGKSSILQSLVLLHQTMSEQEWSTRLMLNGGAIAMGTVTNIVNDSHGRRTIGIAIDDDEARIEWTFSGERDEMSLKVASVDAGGTVNTAPSVLQHLIPGNSTAQAKALARKIVDLSYISAERLSPQQVYSLDDQQTTTSVGPQGEHTLSILYRSRDDEVLDQLRINGISPTMRAQVEARMAEFFPGFGLDLQPVPNANSVVLGLRTSQGSAFHRPTHVGFGLTQVLPIVVAALSARQSDILLVENPEVHLHPAGQALMGTFLAEIANAGVQVIVETHSDHVINGVRTATATNDETLAHDQVAISFLQTVGAKPQHIRINANGELSSWPRGFFDQMEHDLGVLARHRRNRLKP